MASTGKTVIAMLDSFLRAADLDPALKECGEGEFRCVVDHLEREGLSAVADVRLAFTPDDATLVDEIVDFAREASSLSLVSVYFWIINECMKVSGSRAAAGLVPFVQPKKMNLFGHLV